jgi:uncharacterized protein involved in outer membrane biogenesis
MKKWIFLCAGAFVLIVVILFVVLVSNLESTIREAVNVYGPKITRTEVRLGNVSISLFGGKATLKDFYLGNPRGFTSPEAMTVALISINLEKKSITSDTIIIDRIELLRPEITHERRGNTDNFKAILENIKRETGTENTARKEPSKEGKQKKILIRNFIVKDGKINLVVPGLAGQRISASLPELHLGNVGTGKNGKSPAEAFSEVFARLYEKITSSAVTKTFQEELKADDSASRDVGKGVQKEVGSATEKLKGIFRK